MPRVVHFEIPSDDPERATRFYGDLFGWTFQPWGGPEPYWLVSTGAPGAPGIDGGLLRRSPKMPVPGVGWLAYAQDPDGNTFGMMQADPAAA